MGTVTDNFTGTDTTQLTTYSANWTTTGNAVPGSFTIKTNGVTSPVSGSFTTLFNTFTGTFGNDQLAQLTIKTVGGAGQYFGVGVRASSGNGYHFIADSGGWRVLKTIAFAAPTSISSGSNTLSSGTVLTLSAIGTTLAAKIDGVTIYSGTDSALASGSPGLASTSESGTGAVIIGDDFLGTDVLSARSLLSSMGCG